MRHMRGLPEVLKDGLIKLGKDAGAGLVVALVVLASFPYPAQAKMIRGEVVSIRDDGSSFTIKGNDHSKPSFEESFDIRMAETTKFEKISSLKELAAGDEVAVDAAQNNEDGFWEARSVRIVKVKLYQEVQKPGEGS